MATKTKDVKFTTASKGSPLVIKTGFRGYDMCLNTYVGCQFGCKFCYVRFFVKDKDKEWGNFVRVRSHVKTKLKKQLEKVAGDRLVIGTMCDPYQPIERKERITREALKLILAAKNPPRKVGIFTRSPIVLEDLDLIKKLPKARVHMSISPFPADIIRLLEPVGISTDRRIDTIKKLKDAGIRVHVNVAPSLPKLSDGLTDDLMFKLTKLEVDEFFVDPMQAYDQSFKATKEALKHLPIWQSVEDIVTDDEKYTDWKKQYKKDWFAAWDKYKNAVTLPIWSDHVHHTWVDMRNDKSMDPKTYDGD